MKKLMLVLFTALMMISNMAGADVPRTFNYQARLTDRQGVVLNDGTYSITFSLYADATTATYLWRETQLVPVKQGYCQVVLGSVAAINLPFDQQYWLGIKVEADSEMGRQALNSVPYALNTQGPQLIGYKVLTAGSGTYTPTAGTRAILVEVQGSGGGGGGAAAAASGYSSAASGGGGGGYAKKYISSPASSYAYTVGGIANGGAAGMNNGNAGNASTFGSPAIITCSGGGPGGGSLAQDNTNIITGPAYGGSATGGDINIPGGASLHGFILTVAAETKPLPSVGGRSVLGEPGAASTDTNNGNNGTGYGSGGNGASFKNSGAATAGGNGASGVIIIQEFK